MRPPENGQVQGTRVDFGWEPVDGAVDYHFELSRHRDMRFTLSPVFEKLVSRTPSAGQARWRIPYDGLLNPDETYYWRVRARNEDGLWGPWSRTWNFVVRAPGVPQDLALHPDRDAQSILLSWRPSTDGTRPDHYEIYGSNERGFTAEDDSHEVHIGSEGQSHIVPGNLLATTQDTSLQVVGASLPAERGNRGFYRVIAVDADGLRSGASDYAEAPRPFIYSAPPQEIDAGVRQVYDVGVTRSIGDLRSVTDPSTQEDPARVGGRYQASFRDGDELLFLLDEAPAFVTLDRQTGRMILTPGIEDVSTHTITIRVQSNSGGDVQGFDLRVHETTESAEPVP